MLCIHRKIALVLIIAFGLYILIRNKSIDETFFDLSANISNSLVLSDSNGSLITTSNLRIDKTGKNIGITDKGGKDLIKIDEFGKITIFGDVDIKGKLSVNNTLTVNDKFTANKGSEFKGGQHKFSEVDGKGELIIGNIGEEKIPGIYRDQNKAIRVGEWETGTLGLENDNSNVMRPDNLITYWKSTRNSNGIINKNNSGIGVIQHANGNVYGYNISEGKIWTYNSFASSPSKLS
jgi:hypothetical protein